MIYNGTFTLIGPKSHRTVSVKTAKKGSLKGSRIISLFVGTDNTRDYEGYGFVTAAHEGSDTVKIWNSKRNSARQFEIISAVFAKLAQGGEIAGYTIEESRSCVACNRKLTSPESVLSGIGPECGGRSK